MRALPWSNAPASPPARIAGGRLSGARRFAALDSLRGLCALAVVLFHFRTDGVLTNLAPIRRGWMFVDFFFVLSGFVLAHAYFGRIGRQVAPLRFLGLRLGRIYPLHAAVLAAIRDMPLETMRVDSLQLVINDWYMSSAAVEPVATFTLRPPYDAS